MTVIAVNGIGPMVSRRHMVNVITKFIRIEFEAHHFELSPTKKSKTFYLSLPDDADAQECVNLINGAQMNHRTLKAWIPKNVINIKPSKKKIVVPERICRRLNLPLHHTKTKMLTVTSEALLCELYSKYPGILSLSKRTESSIVRELFKRIQKRITDIQDKHENVVYSTVLSEEYRKRFPHKSDWGLVKECYRAVGGVPPLHEQDLVNRDTGGSTVLSRMESVPMQTIIDSSARYAKNATSKVRQYIESLNTEQEDSSEDPRLRVRKELQKLSPYVGSIMQGIMSELFSQNQDIHIRIYGSPTLPRRSAIKRFLKEFNAGKPYPFSDLHNCVDVVVPREERDAIMESDGSIIEGCHLMVRLFERCAFNKLLTQANSSIRAHETNDQFEELEEFDDDDEHTSDAQQQVDQ